MIILAQFVGFIAILIDIYSIQKKEKKNILKIQIASTTAYAIQYSMLRAYAGVIPDVITIIRNAVFIKIGENKAKSSKIILMIFIVLILILGIFTYDDYFSIIPIVLSIVYTLAAWQNNTKLIRISYIFCAVLWIIYNIHIYAYISLVGNVLGIVSGIISLIRYKEEEKSIKIEM